MDTKHIKLHAAENMVTWGIYLEDGTRLALVGGVSQLSKTLAKQFAAAPEMLPAGKHLAVKLAEVYRAAGINPADCQAIREWMAVAAKAEGGAAS